MTRSIAEMTAGKSIDEVVDAFIGGGASEPEPEPIEHVASAADLEADYSATAPGFPEHLEKLADFCDDVAGQLSELPKTASLTGDLRFEFSDDAPTQSGVDPMLASMLDRGLGDGGAE